MCPFNVKQSHRSRELERITGQDYPPPSMPSTSEKNAIYDNTAATARGKGGHPKRISDCISTSYTGRVTRNFEIELEDVHSRRSLRKFVRPHPLRDRLCLSDMFISRVTKIQKS